MLCPQCGFQNPEGVAACAACGTSAPSRPVPPRLERGYRRLEQAAHDLLHGQLTIAEFEAMLDAKKAACEAQLAMITGLELDENLQRDLSEQMAVGLAGIHAYLEGLEGMRAYLREHTLDLLQNGLAKVKEGSDMLNVALTKNWETYYALKESVEALMPQIEAAQNMRQPPESPSQ